MLGISAASGQTAAGQIASAPPESPVLKRTGLELAAQVGWAQPTGETQSGAELDRLAAWQVPIELDVGYRETARYSYGVYLQYAPGSPSKQLQGACDLIGAKCSTYGIRAGLQFLYHIAPNNTWGGWFSFGIGAEYLHFAVRSQSNDLDLTGHYTGIELARAQVGLDARFSNGFSIGPFLGMMGGLYLDESTTCSGTACAPLPYRGNVGSIGDVAHHIWIVLGLRGAWLI